MCADDHRLITEEFNNLEEAIKRVPTPPFTMQRNKWGQISIIPIHGICHIPVKCMECPIMHIYAAPTVSPDI